MVGLEDLHIPVGRPQNAGGLAHQAHQHVDAQGVVAGADHGNLLGGLGEGGEVVVLETRRAHHQGHAGQGALGGQGRGGRSRREIDHHVGGGQGFGDGGQAKLGPVDAADDHQRPITVGHAGYGLAHPALGAGNGDLQGLRGHGASPVLSRAVVSRGAAPGQSLKRKRAAPVKAARRR
jgi:hypothetical protein